MQSFLSENKGFTTHGALQSIRAAAEGQMQRPWTLPHPQGQRKSFRGGPDLPERRECQGGPELGKALRTWPGSSAIRPGGQAPLFDHVFFDRRSWTAS